MMQAVIRLGVICTLAVGVAATANAQSDQGNANRQQPKKERRQPNQVPDNGTGQSAAEPADKTFERVVSRVPVTVRGDGTIVVELNDSFMEAETATIGADGSLRYDHVTGVDRASRFVRARSENALLLPSRPLPVVFLNYPEK